MNLTTELFLVRHGQSLHNQQQVIAGQLDSELTAQGCEDARQMARAIGRRDLDLVYSSDLRRASQTAEIIAETLHLSCPVVSTPLLRELDYGRFTNHPVSEAMEYLNYKKIQDQRYPGGESFRDLQQRVNRFLDLLRREYLGKRILISAHSGPIRMMVILLDSARCQEYLTRPIGNRFLGRILLDPLWNLLSYQWTRDVAGDQFSEQEENGLQLI
jgi:probable phosphoglycerate mutase